MCNLKPLNDFIDSGGHFSRRWPCLVVVLLGMVLLLGLQLWPQTLEILGFSRAAYARGAVWQLLTSQLVHLNWPHTWVNALALALTLIGWNSWIGLRDQLFALAGGMLGVALVLALDTDCAYYAGLSGALHGLWAGNAVALLARSFMQTRQGKLSGGHKYDVWQGGMAVCVLLLLLFKLWWQSDAVPDTATGWLGIPIYRPAHGAGLAGGLGLMGWVLFLRRPAPGRRQ